LRARLKRALDEMGVKGPKLSSIVLSGYEGAASVRGARPPKTANVPVALASAKESARTQKAAKQKAAKAGRGAIKDAPAPDAPKQRDFGSDNAE
jgi:moderate conductance mechanosensitive channel